MRFKRYIVFIFFLLLSLTSINIIYHGFFIYNSDNVPKNEDIHQFHFNNLKLSLIDEWNTSWENGANEYGMGIAVNELNGDIYVTGYNGTPDNDVILIKYNYNGEEQWSVIWDNGNHEIGKDVAIDSQGYIYVAAGNQTIYPNNDLILLKFNSSGHLEWKRTWDSGFYDETQALKIDSEDNIYIVGHNGTSSRDIFILKYNSTGHFQWKSTYKDSIEQISYDLVLDSSNNIYVAGYNGTISPSTEFNLLLAKFDSSGVYIWNRTWGQFGQIDRGYCVTLDLKENVYIGGGTESYGADGQDFIVVKYDSDGNWKWNRTWGTSGEDEAYGIGVDSLNKIYVSGYTLFHNVSIITYNTSGYLLSTNTWAENSKYQYWWNDMTVDSLDRIYITGYNRTFTQPNYDIFIGKYSIEYPGGFILSSDSGPLDDDGNFTLSWTSSSGANNYSIFQYSSYITEINKSLTILEEEIDIFSLPLTDYSNGTYYFIGAAFNNHGNRTSNGIKVTVAILPPTPPSSFTLSSNAGTPDNDGNFTLTWTSSSGANNYSIYQHSSYITEINNSLVLLEEEIEGSPLPLTGYSNGTYYFIVVAFNNYGNRTSNNHRIDVEISPEQPEDGGGGTFIQGYNMIFLIVIIGFVSSIIIYRRLKFK